MKPEQDIASNLAESVLEALVRRAVRTLQTINDCLSGDDSGLANVWEEVCVQVQHEQSVAWDAYLEIIEGLAERFVSDLKPQELEAVWLSTPEGRSREDEAPLPVNRHDVSRHMVDCVLDKAGDWSNARIREYLDEC